MQGPPALGALLGMGLLTLAVATQAADTPAAAAKGPADTKQAAPSGGHNDVRPAKAQAARALVDINSAAKGQLKMLPGVDDRLAEQIVKGRPYKVKAELVTRSIIPPGAYEGIRGLVIAKPSARSTVKPTVKP